jgi:hypothetical protein
MKNPFAQQFTARIAPLHEQRVWDGRKFVRESYAESAFRSSQGATIPVCVNHDENLHVGYIDQLFRHDGWWWAAFRLDRSLLGSEVAAEHVKPRMPVSIGGRSLHPLEGSDSVRHIVVRLEELSLLGAGQKPQYKGAEIVYESAFCERGTKYEPVRREPSHRPLIGVVRSQGPRDARELAYARDAHKRGVIVRFGAGQVLGVR